MEGLGEDVLEVWADTEIIIHLKKKDAKVDEERLAELLKEHKVKVKGLEKDASYIL